MSVSTYRSKVRTSGFSLVVTVPAEIVRDLELSDGDPVLWSVHEEILSLSVVRMKEILKSIKTPGEKEIKKIRNMTESELQQFAVDIRDGRA